MSRVVLRILTASITLLPTSAWAQTIGLVHVTSCPFGAYPATTCSIPATGSGHLIVVAWLSISGTTPTIGAVTDNAGNTYNEAGNARAVDTNAGMVDIWYAKNCKAGATTLTIIPVPNSSNGLGVVWELSNADLTSPLDQTAVLNNQAATALPAAASVTTTAPGVVISIVNPQVSITNLQAGSAFTNDSPSGTTGVAHMITTAAGTYTAQWAAVSGTYASSTVAFKATSACDLAAPFGTIDANDVQAAVNMSLGLTPCTADIAGPNVCNAIVVQRVINASLSGQCLISSGLHVVSLAWTASTSSNIAQYQILRGTTQGGPYALIGTVNSNIANYMDTTVLSGTTYYYVVSAVDTSNNSGPFSSEVVAAIPVP